jgi:antibiotic biosynthesis monooxygenase (ABM) superfamily enzyme
MMTVCVIIRRTVQDEKTASKLAPLIVKLRSQAAVQPGYITDQTFSSLDCEGETLVISTWHQLEDWNRWMHCEERQVIQRQIDSLTREKTIYRYYEPIIGGILPKFETRM